MTIPPTAPPSGPQSDPEPDSERPSKAAASALNSARCPAALPPFCAVPGRERIQSFIALYTDFVPDYFRSNLSNDGALKHAYVTHIAAYFLRSTDDY